MDDFLASNGSFSLESLSSSHAMSCTPAAGDLPVDADLTLDITCTLDESLAPGEEWRIDLVVQADEPQTINNVADVRTGTATDPNPENNHAIVEHDVTALADLILNKTDDDASPNAGDTFVYTMEVFNSGPSSAVNAVLKDTLPMGLEVISIDEPAGASCATSETLAGQTALICQLGTIDAGDTRVVNVTVRVAADVSHGAQLSNMAMVGSDVYDPNNGDNIDREETLISAFAELHVEKTDNRETATAGEALVYEVSVENRGPSVAHGLGFRDLVPDGLTYVGYDIIGGSGMCTYDAVSDEVNCLLGDVPAGESRQVLLHFLVDPSLPAGIEIENQVRWYAATPFGMSPDSDVTDLSIVSTEQDMRIEKRPGAGVPVAGSDYSFIVEVWNGGPSTAHDVLIQDDLAAAGVEYRYATGAACTEAAGLVSCELGDMLPNTHRHVEIFIHIPADFDVQSDLVNAATLAWDADGDGELDSDTEDETSVAVEQRADLRITKYGKDDGEVEAGEILEYTVVVDNLGPSYADGAALKDILSSSGSFDVLSIESDREARCESVPAPDSGVNPFAVNPGPTGAATDVLRQYLLDCNLISSLEVLDADGTPVNPGRWILKMQVRAREMQDINNTATALSNAYDPDQGNNLARVEHAISASADLGLTKVDSADPVFAGWVYSYTLEVTNHGVSTAENVEIVDTLPLGLSLVAGGISVEGGPGSCGTTQNAIGNLVVRCLMGEIAPLERRRVILTVLVGDDFSDDKTIIYNQAVVTSDNFDPDNSNNIDAEDTTILTKFSLDITKQSDHDDVEDMFDDEQGFVIAGENLRYTINVVNGSPVVAENAIITDRLSQDLEFVSAQVAGGMGTCDFLMMERLVVCEVGDIAPGDMRMIEIIARVVDQPFACLIDQTIPNKATVKTDNGLANFTMINTRVKCQPDVYIDKVALNPHFIAGDKAYYRITFGNNGPWPASDVQVRDILPRGLTFHHCEGEDPASEGSLYGGGRNRHARKP